MTTDAAPKLPTLREIDIELARLAPMVGAAACARDAHNAIANLRVAVERIAFLDGRVAELLEANNREVERRRAATDVLREIATIGDTPGGAGVCDADPALVLATVIERAKAADV